MKLSEFIEAVLITIGHSTEDMDSEELESIKAKIRLAADMGMDAIARETYPLEKSEAVNGIQEYPMPDDCIKLLCYCGGKAERYVDEAGKEVLRLLEAVEYRITYTHLPQFISEHTGQEEYTFKFPRQVLQALIYYCCYHVLSPINDKREYAYFVNQYNQQCANIVANLPRRCRVVGGKHGI
ncbi:MAG: hypothetical protein IKY33_00465 [Clostridia bacterium]|nr:hypothetical protein [Clostridia bacterium]